MSIVLSQPRRRCRFLQVAGDQGRRKGTRPLLGDTDESILRKTRNTNDLAKIDFCQKHVYPSVFPSHGQKNKRSEESFQFGSQRYNSNLSSISSFPEALNQMDVLMERNCANSSKALSCCLLSQSLPEFGSRRLPNIIGCFWYPALGHLASTQL